MNLINKGAQPISFSAKMKTHFNESFATSKVAAKYILVLLIAANLMFSTISYGLVSFLGGGVPVLIGAGAALGYSAIMLVGTHTVCQKSYGKGFSYCIFDPTRTSIKQKILNFTGGSSVLLFLLGLTALEEGSLSYATYAPLSPANGKVLGFSGADIATYNSELSVMQAALESMQIELSEMSFASEEEADLALKDVWAKYTEGVVSPATSQVAQAISVNALKVLQM